MTHPAGRLGQHAGHRADIDGLRAVAVAAVVLHHLGLRWPAAGFAGVDVFFVISGFLIGGILLRETADGRFRYGRFYARRARRILPALFVMMLVTLPFGWGWMYPDQLRYYSGAIFATLFFLSNVWFWQRIDYFNPEAALDPLVHTWSLGVEEQFYILLPLLIAGLWRFGKGWLFGVLASCAAASFALMLIRGQSAPSEAFYLIHARAWELLLGVGAAAVQARARAVPVGLRGVGATFGLVLLATGLIVLPEGAAWPGLWTLMAVIGAMLIVLWGDAPSPAHWCLTRPPMVWLGLISYSLYLWHQPVISLLHLRGITLEAWPVVLSVLLVCLVLAAASWRFVEQPFRQEPTRPGPVRNGLPRWQSGLLAAMALALAGFAVGGHVTRGYPQRLPAAAQAAIAYERSYAPSYARCARDNDEVGTYDPASACVHGAAVPPEFALWGDSHAAVLSETLGQALAAGGGAAVAEFTIGGCPPILGVRKLVLKDGRSAPGADYCDRFNRIVLDHLLQHPTIRVVVLNAFWIDYVSTDRFDSRAGWVWDDLFVSVPLTASGLPPRDVRRAAVDQGLDAIIAPLQAAGKTVVVLQPLPMAGMDLPQVYANRLWQDPDTPADLSYPMAAFDAYAVETRDVLRRLADRHAGLLLLDASAALCTVARGCTLVHDRIPLYSDFGHLSLPGVAMVVPVLARHLLAMQPG